MDLPMMAKNVKCNQQRFCARNAREIGRERGSAIFSPETKVCRYPEDTCAGKNCSPLPQRAEIPKRKLFTVNASIVAVFVFSGRVSRCPILSGDFCQFVGREKSICRWIRCNQVAGDFYCTARSAWFAAKRNYMPHRGNRAIFRATLVPRAKNYYRSLIP